MHYRLKDICRRHWNAAAKRNAMGEDFESTIKQVLKAVPNVLEELPKLIPADFPASVSEPIFEGIRRQAQRLAAMAEPTRLWRP
jgi:serine/threonine-protein kinase HipA